MDGILVDIIIIIAGLTLVAITVLTICSVCHSLKVNKPQKEENGVPLRAIRLATVGFMMLLIVPTLIASSLTDMCIITALVMLCVASMLVLCGRIYTLSRSRRQ